MSDSRMRRRVVPRAAHPAPASAGHHAADPDHHGLQRHARHPLFVHVPVILIPTTVIAAIICMVRIDWFSRYGIGLAVVSIATMSSIFPTMQAVGALDAALHLRGSAAQLISEHSQAAHYLAFIYVAFTAVLIVAYAARRISGGMPTGLNLVDRALSPRGVFTFLGGGLIVLSLAAAVMVFRVGDLGARAVCRDESSPPTRQLHILRPVAAEQGVASLPLGAAVCASLLPVTRLRGEQPNETAASGGVAADPAPVCSGWL
jgi:hypothetical protein